MKKIFILLIGILLSLLFFRYLYLIIFKSYWEWSGIIGLILHSPGVIGLLLIWHVVFNKYGTEDFIKTVYKLSIILGIIGFIAGFFIPIIFYPEANQGPLLGIFVTGPLGVVIGAALGIFYSKYRIKKDKKLNQ